MWPSWPQLSVGPAGGLCPKGGKASKILCLCSGFFSTPLQPLPRKLTLKPEVYNASRPDELFAQGKGPVGESLRLFCLGVSGSV